MEDLSELHADRQIASVKGAVKVFPSSKGCLNLGMIIYRGRWSLVKFISQSILALWKVQMIQIRINTNKQTKTNKQRVGLFIGKSKELDCLMLLRKGIIRNPLPKEKSKQVAASILIESLSLGSSLKSSLEFHENIWIMIVRII